MKTTTVRIDDAIAGPVLSPAYLVELTFSSTIRACTRELVEWNGQVWYAAGVQVGSINTGQAGVQSVQVTMKNNAFSISTIVLAETASGKRVRIWKLFGEAPFTTDAAVLLFNGVIDDVPELMNVVTFNCSTQNSRTLSIPNVTIGPPYFNHLPRTGQLIHWSGETYELQPR